MLPEYFHRSHEISKSHEVTDIEKSLISLHDNIKYALFCNICHITMQNTPYYPAKWHILHRKTWRLTR